MRGIGYKRERVRHRSGKGEGEEVVEIKELLREEWDNVEEGEGKRGQCREGRGVAGMGEE